jgi:flagellin
LSLLNENLTATNSRILDTNVAEETTRMARFNILVQSGTAMLAQANIMPQMALRLIN